MNKPCICKIWFSKFIFWAKHRCGFIEIQQNVELIGVVREISYNPDDGDFTFNVVPNRGYERFLYYAGRKTSDVVHVEFMPEEWSDKELANRLIQLRSGNRVRVIGTWSYDGVHNGKTLLAQIWSCILGHTPAADGWTEIHPATYLKVLG